MENMDHHEHHQQHDMHGAPESPGSEQPGQPEQAGMPAADHSAHDEHAAHDMHAGHGMEMPTATPVSHDEHAGHSGHGGTHLHESPRVMVAPLVILVVFAIGSGWLNVTGAFNSFMGEGGEAQGFFAGLFGALTHPLPLLSLAVALLGILLAYAIYSAKWLSAEAFGRLFKPFYPDLADRRASAKPKTHAVEPGKHVIRYHPLFIRNPGRSV